MPLELRLRRDGPPRGRVAGRSCDDSPEGASIGSWLALVVVAAACRQGIAGPPLVFRVSFLLLPGVNKLPNAGSAPGYTAASPARQNPPRRADRLSPGPTCIRKHDTQETSVDPISDK